MPRRGRRRSTRKAPKKKVAPKIIIRTKPVPQIVRRKEPTGIYIGKLTHWKKKSLEKCINEFSKELEKSKSNELPITSIHPKKRRPFYVPETETRSESNEENFLNSDKTDENFDGLSYNNNEINDILQSSPIDLSTTENDEGRDNTDISNQPIDYSLRSNENIDHSIIPEQEMPWITGFPPLYYGYDYLLIPIRPRRFASDLSSNAINSAVSGLGDFSVDGARYISGLSSVPVNYGLGYNDYSMVPEQDGRFIPNLFSGAVNYDIGLNDSSVNPTQEQGQVNDSRPLNNSMGSNQFPDYSAGEGSTIADLSRGPNDSDITPTEPSMVPQQQEPFFTGLSAGALNYGLGLNPIADHSLGEKSIFSDLSRGLRNYGTVVKPIAEYPAGYKPPADKPVGEERIVSDLSTGFKYPMGIGRFSTDLSSGPINYGTLVKPIAEYPVGYKPLVDYPVQEERISTDLTNGSVVNNRSNPIEDASPYLEQDINVCPALNSEVVDPQSLEIPRKHASAFHAPSKRNPAVVDYPVEEERTITDLTNGSVVNNRSNPIEDAYPYLEQDLNLCPALNSEVVDLQSSDVPIENASAFYPPPTHNHAVVDYPVEEERISTDLTNGSVVNNRSNPIEDASAHLEQDINVYPAPNSDHQSLDVPAENGKIFYTPPIENHPVLVYPVEEERISTDLTNGSVVNNRSNPIEDASAHLEQDIIVYPAPNSDHQSLDVPVENGKIFYTPSIQNHGVVDYPVEEDLSEYPMGNGRFMTDLSSGPINYGTIVKPIGGYNPVVDYPVEEDRIITDLTNGSVVNNRANPIEDASPYLEQDINLYPAPNSEVVDLQSFDIPVDNENAICTSLLQNHAEETRSSNKTSVICYRNINETETNTRLNNSLELPIEEDNHTIPDQRIADSVIKENVPFVRESVISSEKESVVGAEKESVIKVNAPTSNTLEPIKFIDTAKKSSNVGKDSVIRISASKKKSIVEKDSLVSSTNSSEPKLCLFCKNTFQTNKELILHKKMFKWDCDLCKKHFASKRSLRKHIIGHNRLYACDKCNMSFAVIRSLRAHSRVHTGIEPFACDTCDSKFPFKKLLLQHMKKHGDDKSYMCQICDKRYTDFGALTAHSRTHNDIKQYQCKVCKKCFMDKYALRLHTLGHKDVKPFTCPTCKKTFRNNYDMRTHSNIHSEVKKFICVTCKKGFISNGSLRRHALVHNTKTLYECKICNEEFTVMSNLRNHLKTHRIT